MSMVAAACRGEPSAPDDSDVVVVDGMSIRVHLDRAEILRTDGTAYVIGGLSLIVLRIAADDYRAFSNVCTHAGCGIFVFQAARMLCQCHGSEFDLDGRPVAGPAPLPLTRYSTELDATGTTLTIVRTT